MKANILLVDDRRDNLIGLQALLKDLGHNLVAASSGQEALLRVLEHDFALILLDVRMPEMDGFETATYIRQRERSRHTPIIFVTASTTRNEEYAFKGYQHGAVDYILKPIVPEILKAKVTIFVDLFEKTERLKVQSEELRRTNAELEQFAAVASHDLQEPLRKIAGFIQLLEERYKGQLDAEADKYIQYVVRGAIRMQDLITDLLQYSRAGKWEGPLQVIDSDSVLNQALENLQPAIEKAGARITHDPMPSVRGDPVQLGQVFQNLIGNSLKFHGDAPPDIHIGAEIKDDQWVFSIRDNGIGIDAHDFNRIFAIFKRLHPRERFPGTGIGLSICKKVIESHGGRIWVESRVGKGATFYFTLPTIAPVLAHG